MADYYTPGTPATKLTLARAELFATELTTIKAAFDKIPEQLSLEQDRAAYALDTGAADAYLVALPAALAAYTTGQSVRMKAVNANTGASTLNVDGLGVKTITRFNGDALSAGDIPAASLLEYYYDGTNFQLAGGPATITNAVIGPASATDNAVARFNGTTGKSVQNSGVTIDDSDVLAGITRLNIDNLRLDGNTLSSTDSNGNILLDANGTGTTRIADNVTIGDLTVAPDGTLHIHTATAGSVTANANADDVIVESSGNSGVSILSPDASVSSLFFGSPTNAVGGTLDYQQSTLLMRLGTNLGGGELAFLVGVGVEAARFDANGSFLINDAINTKMVKGLTVNQGAQDDEIVALKSSDVGHAMTAIAEADTFGTMQKVEATSGGLQVTGFKDADGLAGQALSLHGRLGEAADTTDTATSEAVVRVVASVTDGGTSTTAVASAGNVFSVENDGSVAVLIKGDGKLHITNIVDVTGSGNAATAIALDGEDDVALLRVHQRTVHKDMGIAMSKWDESISANAEDLKRVGVLSSEGHFTIVQRMNSLLGGAIWQTHTRLMELQERLEKRLSLTERKLAALPTH